MSEGMPLVDDLADVLVHMVVGWEPTLGFDLAQHPEVRRVMARYRESKAATSVNGNLAESHRGTGPSLS